jgi:hypothetical protein
VYLGGDPAKDGKIDFAGMTAGYSQFSAPRTNRASRHAPRCRWFCPLVLAAL